jgi:hypothetical protein
MKKALVIVAMLLLVTPVMATTTISAVQGTQFPDPCGNKVQPISITYSSTVDIRAFALDINIDDGGPNFKRIYNFKTGESNGTVAGGTSGYGIFPGKFRDFINPAGPNWVDTNYDPIASWNDTAPDHNSGMGFPKMIVEMGALYVGDPNKPASSGTLFTFDVNSYGVSGTFCITIKPDVLRGGVVNIDGNDISKTPGQVTFNGTCITFAPNCTTPANEVGVAKATAESVWTTAGFTNLVGTAVVSCPAGNILTNDQNCIALTDPLHYTYSVAPAEPNVRGMSRSAAVASLTGLGFVIGSDVNVPPTTTYPGIRTVLDQNPTAGTTGCGTTVHLNVVSYPIKDTASGSFMANWITNNRPECWAYPRQCHGNADGKKQGGTYVGSNELTILKAAYNKGGTLSRPSICACFDHLKQGGTWVGSNELTILKKYYNSGSVPLCGSVTTTPSTDPNFWYWCLPTGGTCDSGQICAPLTVCPNTP